MKAAFSAFFLFFTTIANGLNHLAAAFSLVCEYFRDAALQNLDETRIEARVTIAKAEALAQAQLPAP